MREAMEGCRRGRQLRRRVPRRPLDRRPGRLRPHPRDRHRHPARRRPRARRLPLPAGLDRRGLRLDRVRLLHRDLAARPLLALLGDQGGRRPARLRPRPHLRHRGLDRARLQQLRPAPVPGEADPADHPERDARRLAAGLRRRQAGPQLALRRGLLPRHPHGADEGQGRRGLQRRRPRRVREHRGGQAGDRADRQGRVADRVRPATAPATTAATRSPPTSSSEELGWEAEVHFAEGLEKTVAWYRDNEEWWGPIRSGEYREYYEKQYGKALG